MAWIELHQSLVGHRKLMRLKNSLHIPETQAIGMLCCLWLWALDNAREGDVSGLSGQELAEVMHVSPRKAAALPQALEEAGFLDREGESLRIHDWEDYAGRLIEARRHDAERKRKKREKYPADIRGTSGGRPALPNQTIPDQTQPDQTISLSGDDDARGADERAQMHEYLLGRGLLPESYFGATEEVLSRCGALAESLLHAFAARPPTELDRARVFQCVTRQDWDENKQPRCQVDPDREELLRYAFEQAASAGQGGNWSYIQAVLERLGRRGIRSLAEAEDYDLERT